jgi:hypothetical protein
MNAERGLLGGLVNSIAVEYGHDESCRLIYNHYTHVSLGEKKRKISIRCETCRDEDEVHIPRLFLTAGFFLRTTLDLGFGLAFGLALDLTADLALTLGLTVDLVLTAGSRPVDECTQQERRR